MKAPLWRSLPEVGTILGIRFVIAVASLFGRRIASAFLWILALYYTLVSRRTRRASRSYLARVGIEPTFLRVVKHVHTFARVALDRLFFLRDRDDLFEVNLHRHDLIQEVSDTKKGAILLGSHLGSFEALRSAGKNKAIPLSIVVDDRSAERMGRMLKEISPRATIGIIPVDPSGVQTALGVRGALKRGELVGILADRTTEGGAQRNVTVDFLGAKAELPAGPFLLARALRSPVYFVCGLFFPPNRYELIAEPFTCESLEVDAQRFAERLEHHAKSAPYNWFNFFDFWAAAHKNV